jgi:3-hydroxybutyryl-CoA dehydratase
MSVSPAIPGGLHPPLDAWLGVVDAWSRAWLRSVAPIWTWTAPAAAVRSHPPGRTIDQLSVGQTASVTRRVTQADIDAFASISGDDNPAHVDAEWAERSPLKGRVAHGMLTAGLISAVLGTLLPGPGSIYMSQTLKWLAPVRPGDLLAATVTVKEIIAEKGRIVLETVVTRGEVTVLSGEALVKPPVA